MALETFADSIAHLDAFVAEHGKEGIHEVPHFVPPQWSLSVRDEIDDSERVEGTGVAQRVSIPDFDLSEALGTHQLDASAISITANVVRVAGAAELEATGTSNGAAKLIIATSLGCDLPGDDYAGGPGIVPDRVDLVSRLDVPLGLADGGYSESLELRQTHDPTLPSSSFEHYLLEEFLTGSAFIADPEDRMGWQATMNRPSFEECLVRVFKEMQPLAKAHFTHSVYGTLPPELADFTSFVEAFTISQD